MRRTGEIWSGHRALTRRVNPGQSVNHSLIPKSYVKLTPVLLFAESCGATGVGEAPVFVLAVNARSQNDPIILGILFVFEWRHCALALYFGPEFLIEPDFIAQAIAPISAAVLASSNAGPGLAAHGASADLTSPKFTLSTPPRNAVGETLP
jgi:hypothetical protein